MPRPKFEAPGLGPAIRSVRESRKLTQKQVADALGVGQGYVSDLESAGSNPPVGTLLAVADALGIAPKKILDKIGNSD